MKESQESTDRESLARTYYEALDSHDYDRLGSLLAPAFVQNRPDMTLSGREEFVEFMRENRPISETTHPIETVYHDTGGLAVRGRLVTGTGETITRFIDCFEFADGRITKIETFTD